MLGMLAFALVASMGSAAKTAAPVNNNPPKIQGTAEEGETLNATPGDWSGTEPIKFTAQWRRCSAAGTNCVAIAGATGATYRLRAADVGATIRVTVMATNRDGSAQATSRPTAVVKAAVPNAPTNSSAPTISGTAKQGQTLTADRGEWSGTSPIDFNYQWQRCDQNGGTCSNIAGATKQTYVLTSADVGNTVRVRVTATNSAGRTTTYSRPTALVVGATNPPPPPPPPAPPGSVIPVSKVGSPERLVISEARFEPAVIRSRNEIETIHFRIMDTKGRLVSGALVLATPLPYVWASAPAETVSDSRGVATVQFRIRPLVPRKSAIVVFARARKPGDSILAGISSRRLVQVLVNIG